MTTAGMKAAGASTRVRADRSPVARTVRSFGCAVACGARKCARGRPLVAAGLLTLALSIIFILFIDRPLALALKGHNDSDLTTFFRVVTALGSGTPWFVGAALVWLGARIAARVALFSESTARWRRVARSAAFMFASLAASTLAIQAIKIVIGRLRPRYLFADGTYGFSPFNFDIGMVGFPSGHTQTICAAMMALYFILPRYDVLYILVALLVGLSRIVITVHYVGDVIVGAYVGIAVTILVRRHFERTRGPVRRYMRRDRILAGPP